MPDNLAPPSWNSADPRPHQSGRAEGTKRRRYVSIAIEWMVDTGAQISVVTSGTGAGFDLNPVGGSASGTTGGGGILIKSGLTTIFEVFDKHGQPSQVTCALDVGVKPNNSGAEILGMDQVAHAGAQVEWDPTAMVGRLRVP